MEDCLQRFVRLAERENREVSVVMVDLDHFKKLNDEHGHAFGDAVLRDTAMAIVGSLRETDVVCRYGGEELVVILPDCTLDRAVDKAEMLRLRVEALSKTHGAAISASFGAASVPYTSTGVMDLLAAADAALYRAKQEGRNRVVAAPTRPFHLDRLEDELRADAAGGGVGDLAPQGFSWSGDNAVERRFGVRVVGHLVGDALLHVADGLAQDLAEIGFAGEVAGDALDLGIVEQHRPGLVAEERAGPVGLVADHGVGRDVDDFRLDAEACGDGRVDRVPGEADIAGDVEILVERVRIAEELDEGLGEILGARQRPDRGAVAGDEDGLARQHAVGDDIAFVEHGGEARADGVAGAHIGPGELDPFIRFSQAILACE